MACVVDTKAIILFAESFIGEELIFGWVESEMNGFFDVLLVGGDLEGQCLVHS